MSRPKAPRLFYTSNREWCILLESCSLKPVITRVISNTIYFRIEKADYIEGAEKPTERGGR